MLQSTRRPDVCLHGRRVGDLTVLYKSGAGKKLNQNVAVPSVPPPSITQSDSASRLFLVVSFLQMFPTVFSAIGNA